MRGCLDGEHGSKARNSDMIIGDDKEKARCGCAIRAPLVELWRIELEGAAVLWQRCGGVCSGSVSCSE
ncbi:hypothetical protein M0R45_035914 [Rubus argutus]|uniref:Uncharacterized protein n=1 Tax=Rubus argutus TaxID=59490 RepID=A0AAW1W038_RUBAR